MSATFRTRRRLLALAAILPLLSLLPTACTQTRTRIDWLELGRLLSGLDDPSLLSAGQAWARLSRRQAGQRIKQLPALTALNWNRSGVEPLTDDWLDVIRNQVNKDYREWRIVEADGWMLSKLELMIFALAAGET